MDVMEDYDKYLHCKYCELPITGPLVLRTVKLPLGFTLINWPLHPECAKAFVADVRNRFLSYVAITIAIISLIVALLR